VLFRSPFLAQTAERIAKAQASRGAEWGTGSRNLLARVRQVIPLILPLFLISLRRAETMALAMDARGYATVNRRTSMLIMRFTWKDGVAILFGVLAWHASPTDHAPEDMLNRVAETFQVITGLVETNGGIVAEVASDTFKAVFGALVASEDHAVHACNTALAIRDAVDQPAPELIHGLSMSLGVYTDQLLVDSPSSAVRIDSRDMNPLDEWASLMRWSVAPGAVMVTAPTHALVKDLFEFKPVWVGGFRRGTRRVRTRCTDPVPDKTRGRRAQETQQIRRPRA